MYNLPKKPRELIDQINYKGVLIPDTLVAGERKRDGMALNYATGVRLSRDRFMLVYHTVDSRGCDASRSLFYQIRADAPDGPVLKDDVIVTPLEDLHPASPEHTFWLGYSIAKVFGVPKGAVANGQPLAAANHFVLTFTCKVRLVHNGVLTFEGSNAPWPDGFPMEVWRAANEAYPARRQWLQFRLNDAGDDIEITTPRTWMCQRGFGDGLHDACALGRAPYAEPWCVPVPALADGSEWAEAISHHTAGTQVNEANPQGNGVSIIRHTWNRETRRFEWTQMGPLITDPRRALSEPSLVRMDDGAWVLASRTFQTGSPTYWVRLRDLEDAGVAGVYADDSHGQRVIDRCADGVLRIFENDRPYNPYQDMRNPQYCWDVDPVSFTYRDRRVVMDSRQQGLAFQKPFIDHVGLMPHQGRRQLVLLRAMNARQVWNDDPHPRTTDLEWAENGIHCVELIYDRACPAPFQFD